MRKTPLPLLTLILLLSVTALPALAGSALSAGADRLLVVTGTATVSTKADMATIEVGATTRGETVAAAHQQNAAIMEKVLDEMRKMGIPDEDIRTSQYNVYFEMDPNTYGMPEYDAKGVYVVNNMIFVTLRDIGKVSAALDTAAAAGANNIYNLMFQSSLSKEAYHKALARAVEDARAKAEVLARAGGRQLSELVRIESSDYASESYGIQNRADFSVAEAKGTTILSGDVSVTAFVTLSFTLE